jgi:fluoride exporter
MSVPDRGAVMPDRTGTTLRSGPSAAGAPPRGRARARHLWQRAAREIRARWDTLAMIALGGALGSLARWGLATALPHRPGAFPWATFLTNVSGCLLIGALMVLLADVWPPSRYLRPFLGIGVLGGYTTFSTYMLETRALLVSGHTGAAGAYLLGSLAAGMAAVWAGVALLRSAIRLARWRARRKADREDAGAGPAASPPAAPASAHQPPRSP